jgi:hypothetical protein
MQAQKAKRRSFKRPDYSLINAYMPQRVLGPSEKQSQNSRHQKSSVACQQLAWCVDELQGWQKTNNTSHTTRSSAIGQECPGSDQDFNAVDELRRISECHNVPGGRKESKLLPVKPMQCYVALKQVDRNGSRFGSKPATAESNLIKTKQSNDAQ